MKNTWWKTLAQDLQTAADTHDMKSYYDNLKNAYGPRDVYSAHTFAVRMELLYSPINLT